MREGPVVCSLLPSEPTPLRPSLSARTPVPTPLLAAFSRAPRRRAASRLRYFGTQRGLPADIRKYRGPVFRNPFVRSADREGSQRSAAPGRRELQTRSGAGFAEQVHAGDTVHCGYCAASAILCSRHGPTQRCSSTTGTGTLAPPFVLVAPRPSLSLFLFSSLVADDLAGAETKGRSENRELTIAQIIPR